MKPMLEKDHHHVVRGSEDEYIPSTARLESFSDAVIAIVITLLIFEIQPPELHTATNAEVFNALRTLAPKFFTYTLSFVTIAIFWVNHHHFFERIEFSDKRLLWYNNHLLFWLAIIPFVTRFLGEHLTLAAAASIYGFVLFMAASAFTLMAHYVFFESKLIPETLPPTTRQQEYRRALFGVILYGCSAIAAFISPYISLALFVIIPAYYFFPKRLQAR